MLKESVDSYVVFKTFLHHRHISRNPLSCISSF